MGRPTCCAGRTFFQLHCLKQVCILLVRFHSYFSDGSSIPGTARTVDAAGRDLFTHSGVGMVRCIGNPTYTNVLLTAYLHLLRNLDV